VDAPLPAPSESLVRSWKTATIVASFVAAVELVLLLVAAFLLLARPLSHAIQHHAAASAAASTKADAHAKAREAVLARKVARARRVPAARLPRSKTGVLVLNGNGRTGAASSEAARLRSLHYLVKATGNARRQDYASTVVMYRRGYEGEGARLARDLHVKIVGPLDGLGVSALHGGQLAVVLGAR